MRAIERRKASIGTRDGNDARASDVDVVRDDDDGRDGRDLEGSRADADADAEDGDASIASHSRAIVEGAGIVVVRGRGERRERWVTSLRGERVRGRDESVHERAGYESERGRGASGKL